MIARNHQPPDVGTIRIVAVFEVWVFTRMDHRQQPDRVVAIPQPPDMSARLFVGRLGNGDGVGRDQVFLAGAQLEAQERRKRLSGDRPPFQHE